MEIVLDERKIEGRRSGSQRLASDTYQMIDLAFGKGKLTSCVRIITAAIL